MEVNILVDEREDVVEPLECRIERFVARDEVEGKERGIASDEGELLQARELAPDDGRTSPLRLHQGEGADIRSDGTDQARDDAIILFVEALLAGLHVLSPLLQRCEPFSP